MPNPTVRASATALPKEPPQDPVVAIAEKIGVVIAAMDKTEDVDAKEALRDYHDALAALAMSQPATTLNGAMIQTSLLLDAYFDQEESDLDNHSKNLLSRRFRFAALSVISVLSEQAGFDPGYFGLNWGAGPFRGTIEMFKDSIRAAEGPGQGANQ
jgi:hypothetical protein